MNDPENAGSRFITASFLLLGFFTLGMGLGLAFGDPGPGTVIGAGAGFTAIGILRALNGPA